MPITKQAIKKLRHDRAITVQREVESSAFKSTVKKARKTPTAKSVSLAFQAVDKASKHHLIHKNTAARLKSRLSKLLKK
jgi:small subunit ribosomal protein S20